MKKLIIWTLTFLLIISSVSAYESKDKYVKLIENTDYCLIDCYTIYEITASDRDIEIDTNHIYFDFRTSNNMIKRKEIDELTNIRYYIEIDKRFDELKDNIKIDKGNSIRLKIEGHKDMKASVDNIMSIIIPSSIWNLELFDKTYSYDEYAWWRGYYQDNFDNMTNWMNISGTWAIVTEGSDSMLNQTGTGQWKMMQNINNWTFVNSTVTMKVRPRNQFGYFGLSFNINATYANYSCVVRLIQDLGTGGLDYRDLTGTAGKSGMNITITNYTWYNLKFVFNESALQYTYIGQEGSDYMLTNASWNISTPCLSNHTGIIAYMAIDNNDNTPQQITNFSINFSYYEDSSEFNTTETYNLNINETTTELYTLETNWTASNATLIFNGTLYQGILQSSTAIYSKWSINATVPLVSENTTASFYWNYTLPNATWTNKSANTQNVKMAYYIALDTGRLNSSYMETEIFKAYFNLTNFSNKATITPSFVADIYPYSASFYQSVSNYLQQYNGSVKTPNASSTSFNLAAIINVSFGGKSFIRTSNTSIGIAKANLFECQHATNTTAIRFTIYDEDTITPLNTSKFEGIFDVWSLSNPTSITTINFTSSGKTNYSFCTAYNNTIYADIYVKYDARFTHRYYLINESLSNVAKNFSIYNFIPVETATSSTTTTTYPTINTITVVNITDGGGNYTSSSSTSGYTVNSSTPITSASSISGLKITARAATNYNYKSNIIGKMQRWYVGENVWRTVQMDKTGDYGLLYYNIHEKDKDYRFIFVDEDDCILKTTNNLKFVCSNLLCDVTYLLGTCSSSATDNFTVQVTYSNATGNITTVWDDPTGGTTNIRSITTRETLTGTLTVCDQTLSGSSGSSQCNITGYTGTFRTVVTSTTNGVANNGITVYTEAAAVKLFNLVGDYEGALWTFGFMLTIVMFGLFSPVGCIICAVIGLIMLYFLGIFSALTLPFIIVACVLGVVIGLKVKS